MRVCRGSGGAASKPDHTKTPVFLGFFHALALSEMAELYRIEQLILGY